MAVPAISVVIPAYNAAATISDQLDALAAQRDAPTFEVVVADNRSTDETASVALRHRSALDLRVVPATRTQGVNCARNTGIAASRAPIVLLIDADDRIGEHALRAMYDKLAEHPEVGIVGGILSMHDPATYELEAPHGYLPYVPGGFMAMRRGVFDDVAGFDEDFVGGHDEVDFCWRAQHLGHEISIARSARLERVERPTASSSFRQFRRYGFSYVQLWVKHRERGIPGGSLRMEVRVLRHSLRSLPRLLSRDAARRRATAIAWGWVLGRWSGNLHFRVWGPK
jgi:GT2 family glycosyltransferase